MPSGSGWSVWICSCRRRVPGHFVECRCGALRAHALGVISPDEKPSGRSVLGDVCAALALVGALVGAWFWYERAPEIPKGAPILTTDASPPAAVRTAPVANDPAPYTPPQIEIRQPAADWPSSRMAPRADAPWTPMPTGSEATPGPAPSTPWVSDGDRARMMGRQQLASEFSMLAGNARRLIAQVRVYENKRCRGVAAEGCLALLEQIGRTAIAVGESIEKTEDIARTSLLDPGVVRDMREQYGLGDSVWDEIERLTREYRR